MRPIYQCYTYTNGSNNRYVESVHEDGHGRLEVYWIDCQNEKSGTCSKTSFEKWAKKRIKKT